MVESKEIVRKGRQWVIDNPSEWEWLKNFVANDWANDPSRPLSIGFYTELIRARFHIHVSNDIRAYLSRRLEKELTSCIFNNKCGGVQFTKSKSKIDHLMKESAY